MDTDKPKSSLPELEEKIIEFWEENKIFEKSILQRKNAKRYVFYDGPPFATGLPHYGHILASTIKDMVPRYWTMRGFQVPRRWGWDCHGLPIETLVEQELNIAGRKAIERFGVKKFNETARSKVLTYTNEWAKTVRRIGRFVDFDNSYATMSPTYMESVIWAFSQLYKKGLVYRDNRTSLFCPRCETPLSNFEIAMDNSYRDQEDDSVYVRLPLHGSKKENLLIWTTTPWTLPGNAAVAVNPKIEYTKYRVDGELVWAATTPPHEVGAKVEVVERISGKALVGKQYEPLFRLTDDKDAYRVVGADFVDIAEGTGLVHIAPSFGEEDFILGKKESLPLLNTLDDLGRFNSTYAGLKFLEGKKTTEANPIVIDWLKQKKLLWRVQKIMHRYPICWRCSTPLIYKVQLSWFIKVSAIKGKMLELNEKIDWHPEHLKHGRFGNDLAGAPDWNISRSRFWGTPIPIWECTSCKKIQVLGSRDDFHQQSSGAKNRYFIMRHGEAENNIRQVIGSEMPERKKYHLTLRGKIAVEKSAKNLKKEKIDFIVASDFTRTKETAELIASKSDVKVVLDERLREIKGLDGESSNMVDTYIASPAERLTKKVPGGETLPEVRTRIFPVIKDLERKYEGKNILIIGHEASLWALYAASAGLSNDEMIQLRAEKGVFIRYAEFLKMPYKIVPRNDTGELDFHLPYIDEVKIYCSECASEAKRVPEVFDCWFESGSMPFAAQHYPFENKEVFEKNFPADFIAEYIAQTRGWFNKLHVLASALFGKQSFRHAVTTGTILSEKGEKLSKSRKNFPDPWILFGKYGVDAMRYYLMASPVMQADNVNFSEKDVDEIYKKYSLISYNVLNLFKLYQDRLKRGKKGKIGAHVLDRWILSRLHSTIREVTSGFDRYEIVEAVRPLLGFIQDLSLWYVRRSRDRIKSETPDAINALVTLQFVLGELSKLMAPVTPFLAEIIYRDLLNKKKISVHLEDWPKFEKKRIDKNLEGAMAEARDLASQALRLRAEAKIKVRQPLAELQVSSLKFKGKRELLELIKNEVNVKEIVFGNELKLDTQITPELKEEGMVREFVRNIQEMRRDLGLKPGHTIRIQVVGNVNLEAIISKWKDGIRKDTYAKEIKIGGKKIFSIERELEFDGTELCIGIDRV